MLSTNIEHVIADADRLRSCRELAEYKALCFGLVPRSARSLLDLGSATGEDVLALAERLGPESQLIGVELDPGLVAEARRRSRNVALDVHFVAADCQALPFSDAAFDVVRADNVLGALPHPALALQECVRVLRPRGLLLVHDEALASDEGWLGIGGLKLVTFIDVPCGTRGTPTWLLAKPQAHGDARV